MNTIIPPSEVDDVRIDPVIMPDLVCPSCIPNPEPVVLYHSRKDTATLLDTLEQSAAVDLKSIDTLFNDLMMLEVAAYKLKHITQEQFSFRSFDGIVDTLKEHKLEALGYVLWHGIRISFNTVSRLIHGVSGLVADHAVAAPVLLSMWKTKIHYLSKIISHEKMRRVRVEVYPYEVFNRLCPLLRSAFQLCYDVEQVCLSSSTTMAVPRIRQMTQTLEKNDIHVDSKTQKMDKDHYDLTRYEGNLAELGYDPSYFSQVITYTQMIAGYFTRGGKPSPLFEERFTRVAVTLADAYGKLDQDVQSGKIKKESTAYRERLSVLTAQMARLQYCSQLLTVAVTLSRQVIRDAVTIFRGIERNATYWESGESDTE